MIVLIWLGLFAATALTDWLSAKWTDSFSRLNRAHLSAVHEAVGFAAGFTVYTWTKSAWTIIPCVIGAWVGSWLAGVDRQEISEEFVQAVEDAVARINDANTKM